jgi:hypothetical protein
VLAKITRTQGFLKAYAKLTDDVQKRVETALTHFVNNPRHPGLHFEKYSTGLHTIRVDRGRWRIVLKDLGNNHYELKDVDRHDYVDRRY